MTSKSNTKLAGGIDSLFRDWRVAVRTLARRPGFSFVAMLVIAVGIGATVSLFTVVWSVLLKPLPFDHPEQLVRVYESNEKFPRNLAAPGIYAEWKRASKSFSSLALYDDRPEYSLSDGGKLPETMRTALCSWDLFPTLGVKPLIGRSFTPADDRPSANATVIITWSLWHRRFGGESSAIGRKVEIDGQPYTIIGVMPRSFAFPDQKVQMFVPVYFKSDPDEMTGVDHHQFGVIGRLEPRVTRQQADQETSAIVRRIHDAHRDRPFVNTAAVVVPLIDFLVGDLRPALYMLLAATGCMLLIACLNVANLLTARAAARRREIAIRTALGGGRLRLIREQLMESFVLFSAGGAAGLALAYAALRWFVVTRSEMVRVDSIRIDGVVAATVVAIIVCCALFAGLIPVIATRYGNLSSALQESSRGSSGGPSRTFVRKTLVAAEVAFTVVLLVSAGLLLKSYTQLRSNTLGCRVDNILSMHFTLPELQYHTSARRAAFFDDLLARARATPGVEAAGLIRTVPGEGYCCDGGVTIAEHPPLPLGQSNLAIVRGADPGYFAAIGIPFLRGRTFGLNQRLDAAKEAIVSAAFARQYLPNEDPIGKHLVSANGRTYQIVGVVGDTRYRLEEPPGPMTYFPIESGAYRQPALVVRAPRDPESLALPIQKTIQQLDPALGVFDVLTMSQIINQSSFDANFQATLLATFAGISLLLAAVGLFGVLAYIVAQRRSEIAIRFALGAQRGDVLRLTLFDGLRPALGGLVAGSLLAIGATQLIRSSLYATKPLDPTVFAGVIGLLLAVAAAACLLPAWRASRVDPAAVLRSE